MNKWKICIIFVCMASLCHALDLNSIEVVKHKYFDTLSIFTSDYALPKVKMTDDPPRMTLDFQNGQIASSFDASKIKSKRIASVKTSSSGRITIELLCPQNYEIASLVGKNEVSIELTDKEGYEPAKEPVKEVVQRKEDEVPASGLLAALDEKPAHKTAVKSAKTATSKSTIKSMTKIAASEGGDSNPRLHNSTGNGNLRGKVIIVDAGHGGGDPGARANGLVEKDLTLQTALELEDILRAAGAKVYMTRRTDIKVTLKEVVAFANKIRADSFVSIHYNFIENPAKKGTETYYQTDQSRQLADAVHKNMLNGIHRDDRGVRQQRFYVIHHTQMPSVLVEPLYLSNSSDADYAKQRGFYSEVAGDIARGLKEYLK